MSLTPHPASSHEVAQSPRGRGTSELPLDTGELPFPDPARSPGSLRPRRPRRPPTRPPPDLPPRSRVAPKPGTPDHPTPRTSQRGRLSPQTSCAAAGSESHPQVIPRALAATTAAAAGIRTGPSMHRAGQREGASPRTPERGRRGGRARGALLAPSRESRAPGTEGRGGGGGGVTGARPRGRAPPRRGARARTRRARDQRAAREEREEGTGPGGPAGGARAACQISGGRWAVPIRGTGARRAGPAPGPSLLALRESLQAQLRPVSASDPESRGWAAVAAHGDLHSACDLSPLTFTSLGEAAFRAGPQKGCLSPAAPPRPRLRLLHLRCRRSQMLRSLGSYLVAALWFQLPAALGSFACSPLSVFGFLGSFI